MPVVPLNFIPGTLPRATDLLEQTRGYLLSSHQDRMNRLAGDVLASTAVLTFEVVPQGIDRGSVLSVGLETFQVLSVDVAGKSATVIGGIFGSPREAHATGDLVYMNPEFTNHQIFRELNMELRSLSATGLYAVKTSTLTYDSSLVGYDMANVTGLIDVLEVTWDEPGADRSWPSIDRNGWRLKRQQDTTAFPSGFALMIRAGGSPGRSVRVTYAKEFALLSTLQDSVILTTGLPDSAIDIPALGAAARLVATQEVARSLLSTQRDPRRAEEVPPGALTGASRTLLAMKAQRLSEERTRLLKRWPIRSR